MGRIISFVVFIISYVGFIIFYVGVTIPYVGLKYFFQVALRRFHSIGIPNDNNACANYLQGVLAYSKEKRNSAKLFPLTENFTSVSNQYEAFV